MLIRLSASLLGLAWIPLGAITIISSVLLLAWFRLPCDLGQQQICESIENIIVQRALFGQVFPTDVLTVVLLSALIAALFGFLWLVSGLNLVRHGLKHQAPHAPDYGIKLAFLTVGALLFVTVLLDQTARPWLAQQQQNFATLAAAPPSSDQAAPASPDEAAPASPDEAAPASPDEASPASPDEASPQLTPQRGLALILSYTQALTITQTVSTTTAGIIGVLGLLLLVSPYPNQTHLHTEQHQCETCGLVGDNERPRCILCHAPLALVINADTIQAHSGQSVTLALTLQPEVNNGLPVRRPELQISMPTRFTFTTITSDGVGKWEQRVTRFGRRNIIKGPAYLSRPVSLKIELAVAPRFQIFRHRTHTIAVKAFASQSTTASGQVRVRVARIRLLDRIPQRVKIIPRNLRIIGVNTVKTVRNLIQGVWNAIKFVLKALRGFMMWLISLGRNWRTAGQSIRQTGQRLQAGFKASRQAVQKAAADTRAWAQKRNAAAPPPQPTSSADSAPEPVTAQAEDITLQPWLDQSEQHTFPAITPSDDDDDMGGENTPKQQGKQS